ncbi:polyglutamine-binding protein 1-like [Babylonia areolata]|uniref:polyglutamine-binding protein 1-like n=1 Tax=Babylonia areolata TaxID=304850 RepID=UPI003FCF52A7
MPLPPALAARLAKRGIIKEEPAPQPTKPVEEVEEVFAEDYDDPAKQEVTESESKMEEDEKEVPDNDEDDTDYVHEVINCPNKANPFHTCVKFCKNRWGMKSFSPESDMLRKRDRMLRKYPLPDGWKEVADPETGRYYYWSLQTDQVSWLSPAHPRAVISMPADKLRETLVSALDIDLEDQDEDMETMEDEAMEAESDMSGSSSDSDSEEERRRSRREPDRKRRDVRENRGRGFREEREKHRGHARRDEIDPMDPAAYSDVPRGGWTEGLDTRGSAKTGVDVTASGPLFQQRPYPSPGDILRANQQLKKKT